MSGEDDDDDDDEDGVERSALVPAAPATELAPAAPLSADKNPYLIYLGSLDPNSRSTMRSTGRMVAATLSNGQIQDPSAFPWHAVHYGVARRLPAALRERGLEARTVNKALTLLRRVMKEAWLLGITSLENYERVRQVKNVEVSKLPAGRMLAGVEVDKVLAACAADDRDIGARDAAIAAVLAGAGLRESEAVKLLRRDYDPSTGVIEVRHGKRRKQRRAYLQEGFDAPLTAYLARVPGEPDDPLLCAASPAGNAVRPLRPITIQAVDAALERRRGECEVAAFTPHDLRRTFITERLDDGVDALRLARAVGHASPQTTMLYDRRTEESDRVAIRKSGRGAPSK